MFGSEGPILTIRGPWGVPTEVHGSIILLALLFVGLGLDSPEAVVIGLVVFAMVFVSILLHELGHAWGALIQGVPVHRVVLFGGGGYCEHGAAGAYRSELIVAMGPIVNLALWAVSSLGAWCLAQSQFAGDPLFVDQWFWWLWALNAFAQINLVLFVLNMIPVQPLDGGKLLHLVLLRIVPGQMALRLTGQIGLVCAVLWLPAMVGLYFTVGWMLLFVPPIKAHWQMARGRVPA